MSNESKPYRIVVLASGRGSNFEEIARSIQDNDWNIEVSALLSDQAEAGALEVAKRFKIPSKLIEKKDLKKKEYFTELVSEVTKHDPDLIVLAGFMRVISGNFIQKFRHRIINIHPSLLPSFKGLNAPRQALDAGAHVSGCTVHLVNEEIDSGAILGQAVVPVLSGDDLDSLQKRILAQEHILLPKIIHKLSTGEIVVSLNGSVDFKDSRNSDPDLAIQSLK